MYDWESIHKGMKHQYVLKNMQEMCIDKYQLSRKFYKSYKEAAEDLEHEGLFQVWCKFKNPGFIKRENRKNSEVKMIKNKDDRIGIKEKDIQKAYDNGCSDVKKTLEDLFPSLELKASPRFYSPAELTVEIEDGSDGNYFLIRDSGRKIITASDLKCKKDGEDIWIPFAARYFVVTKEGNFRILKP